MDYQSSWTHGKCSRKVLSPRTVCSYLPCRKRKPRFHFKNSLSLRETKISRITKLLLNSLEFHKNTKSENSFKLRNEEALLRTTDCYAKINAFKLHLSGIFVVHKWRQKHLARIDTYIMHVKNKTVWESMGWGNYYISGENFKRVIWSNLSPRYTSLVSFFVPLAVTQTTCFPQRYFSEKRKVINLPSIFNRRNFAFILAFETSLMCQKCAVTKETFVVESCLRLSSLLFSF